MKFDVAIIGAGPAGSALATFLARRGRSVALIDRDAFPRDKLCGEFLSYDALPIIDALGIDLAAAPQIAACRVVSRNRVYTFDFPHAARGVSRLHLDALLFRNAVAAGAHALTQTASTLQDVPARVVVGAWGRWGRFDAQLKRSFVRDRSHRNFGFKRHYGGAKALDTIDLYSFEGGYLGASPIESGQTNICGLVHASRLEGHTGRWEAFVETIRSEEAPIDALYRDHPPAQEGFLSSEPVIFRARSPVESGVFMIGDASGIVDPLTGNGMAMALQSAALAAPFIERTLDGFSVEASYKQRHHELFASRIRWSRRVAKLLTHPSLLDLVLRSRPPRAIGAFLMGRTRADVTDVRKLLSSRA
jgi:flavin-dependent dehydrogenase